MSNPLPSAAAIATIAAACHEANREYCLSIGDTSQPAWEDAPDWQKESAIAGVTAIAEGRITAPEQSHESWSAQKIADGWIYGPTKDPIAKEHPCLVPYNELPPEQQEKDFIFFETALDGLQQLHKTAGGTVDLAAPPAIQHEPESEAPSVVSLDSSRPAPVPENQAASDIPEPEVIQQKPIPAAEVARTFAEAPDFLQFPEETFPVDTEIVKTPTGFVFKVPGRAWVTGHGRSIGGAALDAGLLQ